ncbi:MAG: signal peptidase I [Tidjanibacter sp.]|nr:signal peptidase I [Tidjanibacter sp.]
MKKLFSNRWVKFSIVAVIYTLWFVVWTGNLWFLLGLPIIFDLYVTKLMAKWIHYDRHVERKARSKSYRELWSWIDAIVFAVVFASIINIYIFQLYQIPTSSMEKTLRVGDYLWVSKATYGPRMPNTPLTFPLVHNTMPLSKTKKSYSECIKLPYKRLAGRRELKRNDIVVFNFPAGDTVLLENQAVTYYDVLRDYQRAYGEKEGRSRMNAQYTVQSRPVDKREHYVKRAVAVAGDTIQIVHSEVFINGELQIEIPEKQYIYFVETTSPLSQKSIERLEIAQDDLMYSRASGVYTLPLTQKHAEQLASMSNVTAMTRYESVEPFDAIFPNEGSFGWTEDNFGPLWIPKKGVTVELSAENLPLYRRIIDVYEGHDLEQRDGKIVIDGVEADSYTFAMDYYFMMGDNRHNSADSRFWGFVPEDHVVGTPLFVWLSIDKDRSFPQNIRWNRMFRSHK